MFGFYMFAAVSPNTVERRGIVRSGACRGRMRRCLRNRPVQVFGRSAKPADGRTPLIESGNLVAHDETSATELVALGTSTTSRLSSSTPRPAADEHQFAISGDASASGRVPTVKASEAINQPGSMWVVRPTRIQVIVSIVSDVCP